MHAEVLLVRHAQSLVPSPDGPDDYHRPLTETGIAQAERLVEDLLDNQPSLVVSSPYLRAVRTVEPTARAVGLPVQTEHDLREWDSGLEPRPDYARHYAASWDDPHFTRPGGESLRQLTNRATVALNSIARRYWGGTVIVSSHGTFIARALVGFGSTTVDWTFSRAMPMPAIYRLRFTERGIQASGPGLSRLRLTQRQSE